MFRRFECDFVATLGIERRFVGAGRTKRNYPVHPQFDGVSHNEIQIFVFENTAVQRKVSVAPVRLSFRKTAHSDRVAGYVGDFGGDFASVARTYDGFEPFFHTQNPRDMLGFSASHGDCAVIGNVGGGNEKSSEFHYALPSTKARQSPRSARARTT